MRKPDFCICEYKDADQLRGDREADQRLCFCYTDCTMPLLPKSEISSLQPSCVAVQPCLCRTRSETRKTGFLRTRLKLYEPSHIRKQQRNRSTVADQEGVQRVRSHPPLRPNYLIFIGNFKQIWVNLRK